MVAGGGEGQELRLGHFESEMPVRHAEERWLRDLDAGVLGFMRPVWAAVMTSVALGPLSSASLSHGSESPQAVAGGV